MAAKKYFTEAERRAADVAKTVRWQRKHKEQYAAYRRTYMRAYKRQRDPERRDAVLDKLGRKCAKCGYAADVRVLQIDHVAGNGRQERREMGRDKFYRRILDGAPGYQLLCANCNWIKRYDNEEVVIVDERNRSPQRCSAASALATKPEDK